MCGICGWAGLPPDPARLTMMRDALAHRGQDDRGQYANPICSLGHRRLSIIDLTSDAHQPLANEEGTCHLVMNGEIYNYKELRRDLLARGHHFRSQGDAETILHLYEEKNEALLEKLNGIFAFALWDDLRQLLLLARDRLGVKPLYWMEEKGALFFASEIRSLRLARATSLEIDPCAVLDYRLLQYPLGEKTFFRGIQRLLPGEIMTWSPGGVQARRRYWRLPEPGNDDPVAHQDAGARLRELLEDAVMLQMRSDVAVGVHLSGGIDTAIVAGLAARHFSPLEAFTGAFPGGEPYDDMTMATVTARRIGARHHVIRPKEENFPEDFLAFARAMEEPMAAPGGYAQYCVAREAARHVKVVLGGQGADETFGGYARHLLALADAPDRPAGGEVDSQLRLYGPLRAQLTACREFDPALRYLALIRRDAGLERLLRPEFIESAGGYDPIETFRESFMDGGAADHLDRILRFEIAHWLPALLHVEDRTSMAHGLESRVPLLDHRIVEMAVRVPTAVKLAGGRLKALLRKAAIGIVAPEILARPDKLGFPVPAGYWSHHCPARVPDFLDLSCLHRDETGGPAARGRWAMISLATLNDAF